MKKKPGMDTVHIGTMDTAGTMTSAGNSMRISQFAMMENIAKGLTANFITRTHVRILFQTEGDKTDSGIRRQNSHLSTPVKEEDTKKEKG